MKALRAKPRVLVLAAGLVSVNTTVPVHAQVCVQSEQQKLIASGVDERDNLGSSVAIDGRRAVVAAAPSIAMEAGSVYVYKRDDNRTPSDLADDSWIEEATLTAFEAIVAGGHGWSVSISHDHVLVGAPGADAPPVFFSGAAYVYRRDDNETPSDESDDYWVHEDKLVASDAQELDGFGWAASIDGDKALIGAVVGLRLLTNEEVRERIEEEMGQWQQWGVQDGLIPERLVRR